MARLPLALLAFPLVLAAACSPPSPLDEPDAGAPSGSGACEPCVSSVDCSASTCVLLANDSVCAAPCHSDADCAPTDRCVALSSAEGDALSACLPRDGSCGAPGTEEDAPDGGPVDEGPGVWCGLLAGPEVAETNCACSGPEETCAPNHCSSGWYCDTAVGRCVAPPATCEQPDAGIDDGTGDEPAPDAGTAPAPDAGHPSTPDAGTPPQAHLDPHLGGTVTRLRFAVVGDTRPGRIDDTRAYPVRTINGIYKALKDLQPQVDFVVTTGDYMFATPGHGQDSAQMSLYMHARSQLSQPLWPALGNHECTGGTASNCGPEATHSTSNYRTFISSMMHPIGESLAYYARRVDNLHGHWTAKVVVVAPNAWGPVQKAWLERELSKPTTYTFVVHHEPAGATTAPGMPEINRIVARHPVTLSIVGHTHTWSRGHREVIVGNGGAPLTSTVPYGYTLVTRRTDGAIVVTAYDYQTGHAFHSFAVHPDGSSAP